MVPIDKSSTVLTVLLAIVILGETKHLAAKLTGTAMLAAGIFLMLERRGSWEQGNWEQDSREGRSREQGSSKQRSREPGSKEQGLERRLDSLCGSVSDICGAYLYFGKGWYSKCGIKFGNGGPHRSGAHHGVAHCFCKGQTKGHQEY